MELRIQNATARDDENITSPCSLVGLAAPGEVPVSLARTSAGVSFEKRGEHGLKGIGEPVRVWAVYEASR